MELDETVLLNEVSALRARIRKVFGVDVDNQTISLIIEGVLKRKREQLLEVTFSSWTPEQLRQVLTCLVPPSRPSVPKQQFTVEKKRPR